MATQTEVKNVVTPRAILSYPALFKPEAVQEGDKEKYSATLIFEEEQLDSEEFNELKVQALAAAQERWGEKTKQMIKDGEIRFPFRDDWQKKGYPENSRFIIIRTEFKPGVVDHRLEDITDPEELYPGCIVRAQVSAYAWTYMGKNGVSFGLNHVQKLDEGERLDNRTSAADVFDATEAPAAVDLDNLDGEPEDSEGGAEDLSGLI